jgi:hypothetical protein
MKYFTIGLLVLFAPSAFASLTITEIMYDLEGSDAGLEWVEIHNVGSEPIDVSQWFFLEAGIYHGLHPEGFSNLDPGEYGLIVQDLDVFGASVKRIKSSFSLHNTGESLAMADVDRVTQDEISYINTWGASGDGNSLQLVNGSWVSGVPSPGKINLGSASGGDSEDDEDSKEKGDSHSDKESENDSSQSKEKPIYTGELQIPNIIFSGQTVPIEALVYRYKNGEGVQKKNGFYLLNFGDGNAIEIDKNIETYHRYDYPGEYTVVFEYYNSDMSYDAGKNPLFVERKTITVAEPKVVIAGIHRDGGIEIENTLAKQVDVSGWTLKTVIDHYIFPDHSYIGASQKLILSPATLGFSPVDQSIMLVGTGGGMMSQYPKKTSYRTKTKPSAATANAIKQPTPENKSPSDEKNDEEIAMAPISSSKTQNNNTPLVGAAIFSLLAGMSYYLKNKKQQDTEAIDIIGDIELVEE